MPQKKPKTNNNKKLSGVSDSESLNQHQLLSRVELDWLPPSHRLILLAVVFAETHPKWGLRAPKHLLDNFWRVSKCFSFVIKGSAACWGKNSPDSLLLLIWGVSSKSGCPSVGWELKKHLFFCVVLPVLESHTTWLPSSHSLFFSLCRSLPRFTVSLHRVHHPYYSHWLCLVTRYETFS